MTADFRLRSQEPTCTEVDTEVLTDLGCRASATGVRCSLLRGLQRPVANPVVVTPGHKPCRQSKEIPKSCSVLSCGASAHAHANRKPSEGEPRASRSSRAREMGRSGRCGSFGTCVDCASAPSWRHGRVTNAHQGSGPRPAAALQPTWEPSSAPRGMAQARPSSRDMA